MSARTPSGHIASEHVSSPQETWEYIDGLERLGINLGLQRITKLVKELGSPHQAYKTIHVVGTNGKSSTTRFIAALLEAQGHTVGAYVSPHLISLAERQMVNSVPPTEQEFCELVDRVRPAAEKVDKSLKGGERLTQFEILTAAALLYFKEKGCDVAVIEAGLGGRLDATSVISSEVQVLTSIGLEHTELLGDTLSKILMEKAAVIPQKGRVVVGVLAEELKAELRKFCAGKGAECYFLGEQFAVLADPRADSFDISGIVGCYPDVRLKVLGAYQRTNAAVAVAAVELLSGSELSDDVVRTALGNTVSPGRLEVISTQPLCIFDGSHNPQGMAETVSLAAADLGAAQAYRRGLYPARQGRAGYHALSGTGLRHHLRDADLQPAGAQSRRTGGHHRQVGERTGGLHRPRPALGYGQRLSVGDLQPSGAGHRLAYPGVGSQEGTELGEKPSNEGTGTSVSNGPRVSVRGEEAGQFRRQCEQDPGLTLVGSQLLRVHLLLGGALVGLGRVDL